MHHDGRAWTFMEIGADATVVGMWGSASEDVWLWTRLQSVFHWDGRSWSPRSEGLPAPPGGVVAIGGAPEEVFAVGAFGIARFDGERWCVEVERDGFDLFAICATDRQIIAMTREGQTFVRSR